MAQPLNEGDILQVTLVGELFGQQCLNVLYYRVGTDYAGDNYKDQIDLIHTWMISPGKLVPKFLAILSKNYTLLRVNYQPVYPNRLMTRSRTTGTGIGGIEVDAEPSNVSAVITKRGDLANKKNLGSFHLAGIPTTKRDKDDWIDAYVDDLNDFGTELAKPLSAGDFGNTTPVFWSPETPLETNDVTSIDAQKPVRTMRRRGKGYGR